MTDSLYAVPTLAEIAADPARAAGLPLHALAGLVAQAAALQGQLAARLATAESPGAPESAARGDELLPAPAAAAILGVSPLTLLRKRHRAPYRGFVVPVGTRHVRFSRRLIEEFIALHAGSASPARRSVRGRGASGHSAAGPAPISAPPDGG